MKTRAVLLVALMLAGCASASDRQIAVAHNIVETQNQTQNDSTPVAGPVVFGKKSGSTDSVYIPFSNTAGDPVIATEAFAFPRAGGIVDGLLANTKTSTTQPAMIIRSTASASQTAPTALGVSSEYLRLGGGEWKVNSYRMIGFGYGLLGTNAPAAIGYQETYIHQNTYGDLVFATRPDSSTSAPTIRMRITSAGQIRAEGTGYSPNDTRDFANKGYVDSRSLSPAAITAIKALTSSSTLQDVITALTTP